MRKPRKGIVERFLRHLILSRDFHTSLMPCTLSQGSARGEHGKRHVRPACSECRQPSLLHANNLPFLSKNQHIVGELIFRTAWSCMWVYLRLASQLFFNRLLMICCRAVLFFTSQGKMWIKSTNWITWEKRQRDCRTFPTMDYWFESSMCLYL